MNIVNCIKCGEATPEGFLQCPTCMLEAGAGTEQIEAARNLLDISNILTLTAVIGYSTKAVVQSILNISHRLAGNEMKIIQEGSNKHAIR